MNVEDFATFSARYTFHQCAHIAEVSTAKACSVAGVVAADGVWSAHLVSSVAHDPSWRKVAEVCKVSNVDNFMLRGVSMVFRVVLAALGIEVDERWPPSKVRCEAFRDVWEYASTLDKDRLAWAVCRWSQFGCRRRELEAIPEVRLTLS